MLRNRITGGVMSDLKLDVDDVRALGSSLKTIGDEFDGANAHSDRVADAIGHDGLAGAVHDFAHDWDDKRAKMVANIKTLGSAATTVAETFTKADGQLAKALDGHR
jgi:hypothetical protein